MVVVVVVKSCVVVNGKEGWDAVSVTVRYDAGFAAVLSGRA
jgi:hypothetical protein